MCNFINVSGGDRREMYAFVSVQHQNPCKFSADNCLDLWMSFWNSSGNTCYFLSSCTWDYFFFRTHEASQTHTISKFHQHLLIFKPRSELKIIVSTSGLITHFTVAPLCHSVVTDPSPSYLSTSQFLSWSSSSLV